MSNKIFIDHWISLYIGLGVCCMLFLKHYRKRNRISKTRTYTFYVSNPKFPTSKLYTFVRNISSIVLLLAAFLLLISSMGISILIPKNYVEDENRYVLFALDISPSMSIYDMESENRLSAAKQIIRNFLLSGNGSYVSILVFAKSLRVLVPFSQEYRAIAEILERINIGELGNDSALADALLYSENILAAIPQNSIRRDLVFITDGVQNSGHSSFSDIKKYTFRSSVFIIDIGSDDNGYFKYKDVETNAIVQGYSKSLKSTLLKDLANDINASYYIRLQNMQAIPNLVSRMSVQHTPSRKFVLHNTCIDLTGYFVSLFVILCVLFVFLRYGVAWSL